MMTMARVLVVAVGLLALVGTVMASASAVRAGEVTSETPMNIWFHPVGDGSYVFTYSTGSSASEAVKKGGRYTKTPKTNIYYGTKKSALSETAHGDAKFFEHAKYSVDVHNVQVKGLEDGTRYYYTVGDESLGAKGTSEVYSFVAGPVKKWAIYGDYGITNMEKSLDVLLEDGAKDRYDGILHVGDIAYDLHNGNGVRGDDFMAALQPVMATKPYLFVPGNHEKEGNFTHYNNRFRSLDLIGKRSRSNTGLWWSMDVPSAHFVSIDTEVYAYFADEAQQQRQLRWFEEDLIKANKRRAEFPWIILLAHKCDWQDEVDFTDFRALAHKYGVDVLICGHQHNYQRLFPGLRRKVQTFDDPEKFVDPSYWTQIVVGSPGCQEKISKGLAPYKDGIASYYLSYGYGTFTIPNATHFKWEWKQTNRATMMNADSVDAAVAIYEQNESRLSADAEVKDRMTLIQHNHGMRPDDK